MTDPAGDFGAAWRNAEEPLRRSLEQAFAALASGGLACGAVLADSSGSIVAEGRNRAYDPPGGVETLQGNPLAHAEMNVLAAVKTDRELGECTLWTTQEPCSMCTAAAEFTGVGVVRYLAPDPWAIAVGRSRSSPPGEATQGASEAGTRTLGPADDDRWVVAANVLFMLSIARSGGVDHPTLRRNAELEPETTAIVLGLAAVADPGPIASTIEGFLDASWPSIIGAARTRMARR